MFSIPTARRTKFGYTPIFSSSSAESWEWVVEAGVNHERAHVTDVRHVGVQLQGVHEVAGLVQGCVLEGEAGEPRRGPWAGTSAHARTRGGFHASPDDLLDLRVCFEPAGDLGGVLNVAFDAQERVSRPMPMLKALVGEMAAPVSRSRETRAFRM